MPLNFIYVPTFLWCVLRSLLATNVRSSRLNLFWTPGCELFGHVNFKTFNNSNGPLAFSLPAFKTEFQYHCDFQMHDKAPFLIRNDYLFNLSLFFCSNISELMFS